MRRTIAGFIGPAFLFLFSISIFPLIYSLVLSFYYYYPTKPYLGIRFAGLGNFIHIFSDPQFFGSLKNSFVYIIPALTAEFLLGLGIAVLLTSFKIRGLGVIQTLLLIPMMISPAITGVIWRLIYFPGMSPINFFIQAVFGVHGPNWTSDPSTAMASIIIVDIWQWTPFMILCFVAGIRALPEEVFDAAKVEGATLWHQVRHMIVPMTMPVILVALLIRFIDMFKMFDYLYILTKGGPGVATDTLTYFTYRMGFTLWDVGYASASSWILLIITIVMCNVMIRVMYRGMV